jgi:hypothetical protein
VDKAHLSISAILTVDSDYAKTIMQRGLITNRNFGPIPKGSPSGRNIGQESYNSVRPQGLPGGNLTFVARNGRVVVVVQLSVPTLQNTGLGANYVPVNAKDVALVERHAMNVLNRLTTLEKNIKPK